MQNTYILKLFYYCICVCVHVWANVSVWELICLQSIGCALPFPFGYCQCYQLTPSGRCVCSSFSIFVRTSLSLRPWEWGYFRKVKPFWFLQKPVWGLRLGFSVELRIRFRLRILEGWELETKISMCPPLDSNYTVNLKLKRKDSGIFVCLMYLLIGFFESLLSA